MFIYIIESDSSSSLFFPSIEKKKKKTKGSGNSDGSTKPDSLQTFIDSIIIKTEETDMTIKRTRSARRQEERKEDDPKEKLSKKVHLVIL